MRVRLNTRSHPMGDLTFNPAARPGDPDWRVLYGEVGDGASGESRIVAIRNNPQRLDNLVGKIIRIIPDLNEHVGDEHGQRERPLSHSERQPVREDERRAARDLGVRPSQSAPPELGGRSVESARTARLMANSVGYRTWETVNIIERGSNHGWPYREGNQVLSPDQRSHGPLPRGRQDSHADRRRNHRRGRHAEVSRHPVPARRGRRRRHRSRATSTTAS